MHARGIPIPPETVEKFDFLPMLQQLPLQHSAYVLRQVVIPKWTSLLQSTDPRIVVDALSCALTANSIVYAAEPKAYPLRTKTSNGGKDGPDGMIFTRNHIAWLDFSIVHQEAADSHDNIKKGEIYKKNEYAPAEEVGIKVIPFVLSSFGAFGECAESLLKQLRDDFGAKVVRDIRNAIGAKLARSMALFLRHVDLQALRR